MKIGVQFENPTLPYCVGLQEIPTGRQQVSVPFRSIQIKIVGEAWTRREGLLAGLCG